MTPASSKGTESHLSYDTKPEVSERRLFVGQTVGHLGEGQELALSPLLLLGTLHDGKDTEM